MATPVKQKDNLISYRAPDNLLANIAARCDAVAGNPIIVEGWLREQGYSLAMAPSPNVVTVCPVGDPILEVRYV